MRYAWVKYIYFWPQDPGKPIFDIDYILQRLTGQPVKTSVKSNAANSVADQCSNPEYYSGKSEIQSEKYCKFYF